MSTPVHVVHVVHVVAYYPPHAGGTQQVAQQLVRHLPKFGVQPAVITSDIGYDGSPDEDDRAVRLRAFEFAHTPIMPNLVSALLRTPRTAIMHAHVGQAFTPDVAAFVARIRGQPVVAHYHLDVDPSGPLGILLRPYQRFVLRWTLRRSSLVLVPTPDYRTVVTELFGVEPAKITVLPNGTSFPMSTAPRDPPERTWRMISVGRLSDQKNFGLLLDACAHLRQHQPQLTWTLDIYGDGELRQDLEKHIDRLGLRHHVKLRGGSHSRQTLQDSYDQSDLFVLATRKESFGIVYVEAMARGLPIVTTDCPGVRNVVERGRNGLLADHQPASLARAMAEVMIDPAGYRRMSAHNVADARQYRWPEITARLADLYREVLSAAR